MWGTAALVGAPPVASFLLVATANTSTDFNVTTLVGTAITPAIVIGLLLLGKLRTEPEVKRLEQEIESLKRAAVEKDAQMQILQSGLIDKAIPALTRSTLVLESLSPLLQTEVHLTRPPTRRGGGSSAGSS